MWSKVELEMLERGVASMAAAMDDFGGSAGLGITHAASLVGDPGITGIAEAATAQLAEFMERYGATINDQVMRQASEFFKAQRDYALNLDALVREVRAAQGRATD